MKKAGIIIGLILSAFITFLFAKDRQIGYDKIPGNEVFDERDYALQGFSLRKTGIPIGWSLSGEYDAKPDGNNKITLDGFSILVNETKPSVSNYKNFPKPLVSVNEFDFGFGTKHIKFVQPFIDHPPLGGLIYSISIPKDAKEFTDIKPEYYRKTSLYLAVITSILLFIYVLQMFKNPWISTLSVLVYNFVPSYLLVSRYALLENVVAPLSLIMLNLLIYFIRTNKNKKPSLIAVSLSGLTAGLTILAKEPGFAFMIAGLILLLINGVKKKYILFYLLFFAIPVIAYITWGLWLSPDLFKNVFLFNISRDFVGEFNFTNIFTFQWFKGFPFDGWWIWGFVSIIFLFFQKKYRTTFLSIPILITLFIVLFFSGINFPWYYFILIPYLAAASGFAIWQAIVDPNPALLATFLLFPLSSSVYWGHTVFHFPPSLMKYRVLILLFTAASGVRIYFSKIKIVRYLWVIGFIVLMILLVKLNHQGFLYMIGNWGNLKIPDFPILK